MSTLFGLARIGRDAELRTTGQGEHVDRKSTRLNSSHRR